MQRNYDLPRLTTVENSPTLDYHQGRILVDRKPGEWQMVNENSVLTSFFISNALLNNRYHANVTIHDMVLSGAKVIKRPLLLSQLRRLFTQLRLF